MTVRRSAELTREAHELGLIHVNVTGGEPMVRKDIYDVVDAIPKDVVISLVSNSTLLTKEKIDKLKKAGLSTIQLSYGAYYLKHFKRDLARLPASTRASRSRCPSSTSAASARTSRPRSRWRGGRLLGPVQLPDDLQQHRAGQRVLLKMRYHPRCREDNLF